MSGSTPSSNPQPGDGFNEAMMQQMGANPAMAQQLKQSGAGAHANPGKQHSVGSLSDELIKQPVADVFGGLKAFFDINTWLGISPPNPNDQNEVLRKQKMHQRYEQLTAEERQVAQHRYQEHMQRRRMLEEEQAMQRQRDEQQAAQVSMPSGPKRGAPNPGGSGKSQAIQKLTQDRKTLSGPSSAN